MNKPLLALALALSAGTAPAADSPLATCRAMPDERARLACYDAIPLASVPAPAAAAAPAAANPANFGLPNKPTPAEESQTSRIAGRFSGWEPRMTVRLENGQEWQSLEGTRTAHSLDNPVARVSKNAFGGFVMDIDGVSQRVRVKRVR